MSYKAIPGVVYTNPEIAGVGKTEEELQAEGIPYTVKKLPMAFPVVSWQKTNKETVSAS